MQPWTYLFAALIGLGGLYAFIKKSSKQSLGAGLSSAVILALCARSMEGLTAVPSARVAFGICLL